MEIKDIKEQSCTTKGTVFENKKRTHKINNVKTFSSPASEYKANFMKRVRQELLNRS